MIVRYVFHKGKDSAIGKVIIGWTWLLALVRFDWKSLKYNFSHVEIWFPDKDGRFWEQNSSSDNKGTSAVWYTPAGQCFSSTTRGGAKGVRFAPASEVLHHPERWMYIEKCVDDKAVEAILPCIKGYVGRKYDYAGVLLGFSMPINIQDSKKWYCSEIISCVAFFLYHLKARYKRISPRRLARVLGGNLKEVKG